MKAIELEVARKVKAMTRLEVMLKAIEGRLTWAQAAEILRMSPRQIRRLKWSFEQHGVQGLRDGRGRPRRKRIPVDAVQQILWLRREKYPDFSVKHFHEFLTEKHGAAISYTWVKELEQKKKSRRRTKRESGEAGKEVGRVRSASRGEPTSSARALRG